MMEFRIENEKAKMAGSNLERQAGSACGPLLVLDESDKGMNRDHALLGKYRYDRGAIMEACELSFGACNLAVSIATSQGYIPQCLLHGVHFIAEFLA